MIQYPEALERIIRVAQSRIKEEELLSLNQTLGRITAEKVFCGEAVPSFTNSSMDGFAIRSRDTDTATPENPVLIQVKGMLLAGDVSAFRTFSSQPHLESVEIMTGAPLPHFDLDAVIKIEEVKVNRNLNGQAVSIEVSRRVISGENLRYLGSDFKPGTVLIPENTRIEPEHILAAAAVGVHSIRVKKMPKIAVLSTGSELVSHKTERLDPGLIRNSTGPFIMSTFDSMGIPATDFGIISDQPIEYKKVVERIRSLGFDVILSTGAVSMGQLDFVSDVLQEMDARIHFHKVAIRPGKPFLFAEIPSDKPLTFFGIPGNPISTAVALRFFLIPYLRSFLGLKQEHPIVMKLKNSVTKPEGLRCFFKAKGDVEEGQFRVTSLSGQASYVVSALLDANAWVEFPESPSTFLEGEPVSVYPLHSSLKPGGWV